MLQTYVQLAVNVPAVSGVFDYHLPAELEGQVGIGCLVRVPFGAQTVQGVVLRFIDTPSTAKTKPVIDLLDPQPVLTGVQIALAESLARETLNPLAMMIGLMLPAGLSQQADVVYALRDPGARDRESSNSPPAFQQSTSEIQKRLLDLLHKRGPMRGRQIDRHISHVDWRMSAQALVRRGLVETHSVLPAARVRPKYIRTAQLAVPPQAADEALPELGRTEQVSHRRGSALRFLMREPDEVNVAWVYAESGCTLADLQELAERDLIVLRESETWRDPLAKIEMLPDKPLALTSDQQKAWQSILEGFRELESGNPSRPFLLHGVTGSGKTEIYLQAAAEAIRRGRQAIVLVPEIALTPQTVRRFIARFPGQVGLIHSRLSEGERYDTWRRARSGSLKVIIGPRSALFVPLPGVGLIVLDECHDGSYYQSEPPSYHAVSAAQVAARLYGAVCILGSATPTIVSRQWAEQGKFHLLELPNRIIPSTSRESAAGLPTVKVVDMRDELKAGNRGIFSRLLTSALNEVLAKDQQAILFLNRRGTATYVFCRDCGYSLRCPRCETPLTYHTQIVSVELLCHYCGYTRLLPKTCPQCKGNQIRQYGLGSERVETEVQRLFPQARTLRWDWETTRKKGAHDIILSHFSAHRADVLIGTQMLAKGLDFPLVTLVGVVLADVGLNLPDPFAGERLFQVLTQVAGRAGRSSLGGQVILQTFQPEHYAIQAASAHNYAGFYQQELAYRRQLGYPPFTRLVRLEFRHREAVKADMISKQMADRLREQIIKGDRRQTEIIGPVPCYFAKLNSLYRWQIVLRGPDPASLLLGRIPEGWRVEIDPVSLL